MKQPRIWLLLSDKGGDNAQVEMIAHALAMPATTKRIFPKPQYVLGKPFFRPSRSHLDLQRSDSLTGPWPDLIITIGRRPAMAALWVQKQSKGQCKIVLLGRPKRFHRRFSLVIAPAQYDVPEDDKILSLELPLLSSNRDALKRALPVWKPRLSTLAKPLTAVFIGGKTDPYQFDAKLAEHLLASLPSLEGDGYFYFSTSRRTPPDVVATLKEQLPKNASLFCWSDAPADNPYHALLALADRFIVTGDSVSMMVEVALLGKPLAIVQLPYQNRLGAKLKLAVQGKSAFSWLIQPLASLLQSLGILGVTRDLERIHQLLYKRRLAVPLGQPLLPTASQPASIELDRVVKRLKTLIEQL